MELNKIQSSGSWGKAADDLNQNFSKVNNAVEQVKNATTRNKGYFSSDTELKSAFPSANVGDIAYVGSSYPYYIWKWDGSAWADSGNTGGEESVNLGDYYTKGEVDNSFINYKPNIATEDAFGGIKASRRDSQYSTEVKIDPSTGKLYVPGDGNRQDIITQNDLVLGNYRSFTNADGSLTRGVASIDLTKYALYSINALVSANSPIQLGIQLRTIAGSMSNADKIYDSGWIAAGMNGVADESDGSGAVECTLVFTYTEGVTGVPTIDEIKQYVSFEFTGSLKGESIKEIESFTSEKVIYGNCTPVYTLNGDSRSIFRVDVREYDEYSIALSVSDDSPIKANIRLNAIPASIVTTDAIFDSGWIEAGGNTTVSKAEGALECAMLFTYKDTNTGVPTISEIQRYITFSFVGTTNTETEESQVTTTLTQSNLTSSNYESVTTTSGVTRGKYRVTGVQNYIGYECKMSVQVGSPIKGGIQLRNKVNTDSNTDLVHDSGWILAGNTVSIKKADYDSDNAVQEVKFTFTYENGNTGVPTISEIQQYITFSFVGTTNTETEENQVTTTLTQNNLLQGNYIGINTLNAGSRGNLSLLVSDYTDYSCTVSIIEGSPIKAGIQLRTIYGSLASDYKIYDSGWITSGTSMSVNKNLGSTAVDLAIVFTYTDTNNGVPTENEIKQYVNLNFSGVKEEDTITGEAEKFTQNDLISGNYRSFTNADGSLTRGVVSIDLTKYALYSINAIVSANSPIQLGIQLRTIAGSLSDVDKIFDSGWIAAGMNGIADESDGPGAVECTLVFTYTDGVTGVPTIDEIKQYISFEFIGSQAKKSVDTILNMRNIPFSIGIKTFAHRGVHLNNIPENSLAAYKQAARMGFNYAETDFCPTSDNELVLMHDASINRTMRNASDYSVISETVNVVDKTLAHLRSNYVLISEDQRYREPIPTLEEFFIACRNNEIFPIPEIKTTGTTTDHVLKAYNLGRSICGNKFGFCSFSYALLDYARTLDKDIPLYYIGTTSILGTTNSISGETRDKPENIWYPRYYGYGLTKDLIKQYHSKGMSVAAWSVPIEEYNNMIELGVDIIATDLIGSNINSKYGYWASADNNWDAFDYSGRAVNKALLLQAGQSIKSKYPYKIYWGTYGLKITLKGECSIIAPNLSTTVSSDTVKEFVFSGMIDNKLSTFKITAEADSCIYNIEYGTCEN